MVCDSHNKTPETENVHEYISKRYNMQTRLCFSMSYPCVFFKENINYLVIPIDSVQRDFYNHLRTLCRL